ncbi:Predicted AAA-ATPase [Succinivibrio dextrinosolvens DSM 3072]|uniref:Predicted AAA-ATPase n=1 Tax=Succinivibrio dextrinosolvens DSM 3072 TaxID=1123324 RepID=A0A1T4VK91_9GAMM|nr:AAA family ATPase [Succinivibrio dextrinosolvens]SKA65394.1 Predicted AAA-ATPase [Succinivibrio dextrinosolvens DSM 3072]
MNSNSQVYSTLSDLVLSDQVYKDKADMLFKLISVMEDHDGLGSPGIFMMIRPRGFGLSLISQSIQNLIKMDNENDNELSINTTPKIITTYQSKQNNLFNQGVAADTTSADSTLKEDSVKKAEETKVEEAPEITAEDSEAKAKEETSILDDIKNYIEDLVSEKKEEKADDFSDQSSIDEINKNASSQDLLVADEIDAIKTFYNVKKRPVLSLDFKHLKAKNPKEFSEGLLDILQEQFWINHIESHIDPYQTPKAYFDKLLHELNKKYPSIKISILIDNYDVPFMVASEFEHEQCEESVCDYLDMLNVIKYSNRTVKWCLLSGHINFSLASETSEGLPLVYDLSSEPMFAALFGFTREDVKEVYEKEIEKFSENMRISSEEYLDMLEQCYGGFLFADNDELYNPNCPKMLCPACIAHCMTNNGKLLPYSASGKYDFLKNALINNPRNLSWLYGKDGQDPLFSDSIDTDVKGKQLGSLLIQLGFATRTKVIINHSDSYVTWRYRFEFPNLDMKKTFDFISGECSEQDLIKPLEVKTETTHDYEED